MVAAALPDTTAKVYASIALLLLVLVVSWFIERCMRALVEHYILG